MQFMKATNQKALRNSYKSSGLSHFIRRDSFRCNLNMLFSFKRIAKSCIKIKIKIKTGAMILQQNVVEDSRSFWCSLLAFQLKVSYQGVQKL